MVRFFPSIFPNSNLDEAAVVWACAHRQRQVAARRKLRDVVFGALFALFGIVFSVVALLTQVEPSGELSTLGYLLVAGGLVVLLGGIMMIIYAWATDPGGVAGLVKGYWRLIALPYSQGAVLLWDTLATAHASIVISDLDAEKLAELTKNIPADFSTGAEEHKLLTTMKQVLDTLKQVQAQAYNAAFFPMGTEPGRSLAELLAGTSPASPGTDYFILPPAEDLEIESLKSFAQMVAQSLEGSQPASLDAAKESVASKSQLALESLRGLSRGVSIDSEALKLAGAQARMKDELSQALEQLFTPVLDELEDEVESKLDDLEGGTSENIEQIKTRYALKVDQIQSEGAAWLRSLDLNIQQCKMRIDEANRNLEANDETGEARQGPSGEAVLFDHAPGVKEGQTDTSESLGDAETEMTPGLPGTGELAEQAEREKARSALQARRLETRANLTNAQAQYQKLQAERERVSREFEQRAHACLTARDAEIKNCEANREQLRQETWQPILEIQGDKDKLGQLLQQALEDLKPLEPAALPVGANQHSSLPSNPSAAADAILNYRARAIESLRDEIMQAIESLVTRRQVTKQFVRNYCWEGVNVEEPADEYLIPIWFVMYKRKRHWRPFLSVCDLTARGIRSGEQLGIGVDDGRSRPLLDYMSRQVGSDYLDTALSSPLAAIQAETMERLEGELEKMQRWNLIGEDLFKEMQAQFESLDKAVAQTGGRRLIKNLENRHPK